MPHGVRGNFNTNPQQQKLIAAFYYSQYLMCIHIKCMFEESSNDRGLLVLLALHPEIFVYDTR